MHAIRVPETGTADILEYAEVDAPEPAPGELLVEVSHAGVNFIDTYVRSGLYPVDLPVTLGQEGAGRVVAVGEGVDGVELGTRVAWTDALGSYAEMAVVAEARAVPLPDDLSDELAAAVMLQGLTAHYLAHNTYPLAPGERCLVHAGAGGVGRLLIQMAKTIGAEVFATVGTAEKAAIARAAGADHVIVYTDEDFREAVEKIAGAKPLHVVYDGVGRATFDDGLELLAPCGLMVAFGNASGAVAPVDPLRLSRGGSLYLTRPTLGTYVATTEALRARSDAVFSAVTSGRLDVHIGARFPLARAADAHRALEGRATTGKVLIDI